MVMIAESSCRPSTFARVVHLSLVLGSAGALALPASGQSGELEVLRRMFPPTAQDTLAVALVDLDGDGDADAVTAGADQFQGLGGDRVYRNDGTGHFELVPEAIPSLIYDSTGIAHGDVDGDGDADLLVVKTAVMGSADDVLLTNNGAGFFADASAQLAHLSDENALLAALADVDGDGDLDAFIGRQLSSPSLFTNDGVGSFADASSNFPASVFPCDVAFADLDNDGDLDAAAARFGPATRDYLFVNDGAGVFVEDSTQLPPKASSWSASVTAADLDGVGSLDLVFGDADMDGEGVRVYRNDPGGFTDLSTAQLSALGATRSLAAADLDADGDVDVFAGGRDPIKRIVPGSGLTTVGYWGNDHVLLNDGTGALTEAPSYLPDVDVATATVVLEDVDGDGDVDVFLGARSQERLYLNEGDGQLSDVTDPGGSASAREHTNDIALGDVDGDGDLDMFLANYWEDPATFPVAEQNILALNDGTGAFTDATEQLPAYEDLTLAVALLDVDGDGVLEALEANEAFISSATVRLLENDGMGSFDYTGTSLLAPASPRDIATGDVEGDGDDDVLVVGIGARLSLSDGAGGFTLSPSPLPGAGAKTFHDALLGDVDADGDLDIVLMGVGRNRVYENDGTGEFGYAANKLPPIVDDSLSGALGDVEGDGDLDLFIGNDLRNELYLNDGAGFFLDATTAQLPQLFPSYETKAVRFLDADGDGDLDALTANTSVPSSSFSSFEPGAPNRLYRNDGAGLFQWDPRGLLPISDATEAMALGDLDLDGDVDVVFANAQQPDVLLFDRAHQLAWRSIPRLGQPLVLELSGAPEDDWILLAATQATPAPPGAVKLDLNTLQGASEGRLTETGRDKFELDVPRLPSLAGVTLFWQALLGTTLSNLEQTRLSAF